MLTAVFLDLKIHCRYPKLFLIKLLLFRYKLFSVSDSFARRVGHAYGLSPKAALEISTPIHVIARVYDYLGDTAASLSFVDLGCGYGDLLGYVAMTRACDVIGIEKNPAVAEITQRWVSHALFSQRRKSLSCARVHIIAGDICDMPRVLGLYWLGWTGFSAEERRDIYPALRTIPVGAVIATTTYPLHCDFVCLMHKFRTSFFWGSGTVYVYDVVGMSVTEPVSAVSDKLQRADPL